MEHKALKRTKQDVMLSQPIQIRRGIFQENSLTNLLAAKGEFGAKFQAGLLQIHNSI